jgi:biotin operon repressor
MRTSSKIERSKTARLVRVLTMLTSDGRVSVEELARRFSVSKRTIFRDLELLQQIGLPMISHRGWYSLGAEFLFDVDPRGRYIDLMQLSLKLNPLRHSPVFRKLFEEAERTLVQPFLNRRTPAREPMFLFDGNPRIDCEQLNSRPIRDFIAAIFDRKLIRIDSERYPRLKNQLLVPISIRFSGSGPSCQVRPKTALRTRTIQLDEDDLVTISDQPVG